MRNLFLTSGSSSVLTKIAQQNPLHTFYLMSPWQNGADSTNEDQLLELSNRDSIFTLPIAYEIRQTSTEITPLKFNNFLFFTFNTDEDNNLWHRLTQFMTATDTPDHRSLLAIKSSSRKQYLLYTSWHTPADWQAWRERAEFKTITALKQRSVKDWRYSESSYTLKELG